MSRPPRLHLIPATSCAKALVLRRGPTDHVAVLLWDRAAGSFEMGQWLKGRIYEHRADLSPDGRHMIYFAGTGTRWWTALSRAPWLRAIHFAPQDSTWHGGGAFDEQGRVWFNGAQPDPALPDGLKPARVAAFPHGTDGFHLGDTYAAMMQLRGWQLHAGKGYEAVLTKALPAGWHLELSFALQAKNRSIISNRYALVHPDADRQPQADWEWAEPFGDRLQIARAGALWEALLGPDGALQELQLIRDFGDMRFERIIAPYDGVSDHEARA